MIFIEMSCLSLCFWFVPFRGKTQLKPHPDWYLLGVKLKFPNSQFQVSSHGLTSKFYGQPKWLKLQIKVSQNSNCQYQYYFVCLLGSTTYSIWVWSTKVDMVCLLPMGYGKLNTISHRRQTYHINRCWSNPYSAYSPTQKNSFFQN